MPQHPNDRLQGALSPLRRLWNAARRRRLDDDLRQELEAHLALIEEDERSRGLSAEEARHNARSRFGRAIPPRHFAPLSDSFRISPTASVSRCQLAASVSSWARPFRVRA